MQHLREPAIITPDFKAGLTNSLLALPPVPAHQLGTIIVDVSIFVILERLQLTLS